MKTVQVTYTVQESFAQQNKVNIQNVMTDLKALGHSGIFYNACVQENGKTFIHTAFFRTDEDQHILGALPSFRHFQQELKASTPEAMPKQEVLQLVGMSACVDNL